MDSPGVARGYDEAAPLGLVPYRREMAMRRNDDTHVFAPNCSCALGFCGGVYPSASRVFFSKAMHFLAL